MCPYGMCFVCLQKLCLLSHQYTEVLTSPGQSLTNITYFLAVCLTCCHTAVPFPNPGEEVSTFDWLIHYWLWWTKDSRGGKFWSWVASQGITEQLLKNVHTTTSAASPGNKSHKLHKSPWAREMEESQSWYWCGQAQDFLVQLSNSLQWSGGSQWDTSAPTAGSALPQELTQSFQSPKGVPSHLDTSIATLKCVSIHRAVSTVL